MAVGNKEEIREIYEVLPKLDCGFCEFGSCGQFGSGHGKCGYGEDGVLYHAVCIRPWETVTLSILDVAEDWFTYSGTSDPIVITYPSEDEPVTI